jgi:uncharacterized membrane protein YfcA
MSDLVVATTLGFAAGTLSGLLGVGGAVLLIPAFTLALGLSQLEAQATSLGAMIPALAVGAWRQGRHGEVRWSLALTIGAISAAGVVSGAAVAHALPEDILRLLFASLLVVIALRLAWVWRKP